MRFYTVWVRSLKYKGSKPLTYSSEALLLPGQIVDVSLKHEQVLGFIGEEVTKPAFITKPIDKSYALPPLPPQLFQLAAWLQQFYATNVGTAAQQLLPSVLSEKTISAINIDVKGTIKLPAHSLNSEQKSVVKNITGFDTYLLHGRTGSGKTRVYIELALEAIRLGKSVLILVPEIGLTSQLANNFKEVFGERVIVLHSQLTPVQRQKTWLQILLSSQDTPRTGVKPASELLGGFASATGASEASPVERPLNSSEAGANTTPLIVIGPRSALFSPLSNIGLIVVDEAHETAYKQEQAPHYHALRVASQLAHLHEAKLIIGSATPSVSDYYMAKQRDKKILEMKQLAAAEPSAPHTAITVVDLKDRSQFSRSPHLSTPMLEAITQSLARGEQSLVYLNRRGTARAVLCENCGWQALCPHCDLPLIYHGDTGKLRCHTCGFTQNIITTCPICGHPSILFKSFGTKAIFEELTSLFPKARIQRFDTDNKKSERFEQHYESIKRGDVDILVGTQLLAKGLDLPRLSVLGIVLADSSLYLPDFSAQERTYQLLSQVLGRIGRGHVRGHAIVQTYNPEGPILQAVIGNKWEDFYHTELSERQKFHFPPFYHLLKLSCRRASAKSAETVAQKLKQLIAETVSGVEINGPAPSFHEKLSGKYQYQLVVKSTNRSKLIEVIRLLPASGWTYDIDPTNLL